MFITDFAKDVNGITFPSRIVYGIAFSINSFLSFPLIKQGQSFEQKINVPYDFNVS